MTVPERRTRQRLVDALNGGSDNLDPAVRRGLIAIADEADGIHDELRSMRRHVDRQLESAISGLEQKMAEQSKTIAALQRTMYGMGATIVTILLSAAVGVFFTR